MLHAIDWQRVLHDPRFWGIRYGYCDFPGTTWKESRSWYKKLMEDDQDQEQEDREEGWTLSLTFPEGYTWQMDYTTEDEMANATYHALHHPTLYPEHIYPDGASLAEESADEHLPGLRWAELKHIGACVARHWQGDFDVQAVIPLLYPVVRYITFDEFEEVSHTLTTAWQNLKVLDASQVDHCLAQVIIVYDKGQLLKRNEQKEWEPLPWDLHFQGDLWIRDGEEWKTRSDTSMRAIGKDSHHLVPFFSMLEQYA